MWSWVATSGAWAAGGADVRWGSSAVFGVLNRKLQPTWAYCGTQPLNDASSSATGDVLSDAATDGYKYCVARKGGECRAASQVGDVYMNCPNASKRSQDGNYGCSWNVEANDVPVDMCLTPAEAASLPQIVARGGVSEAGGEKFALFPVFANGKRGGNLRRPVPKAGEHTREILVEIGMDDGEIAELLKSGAVKAG